jgi:hypothetical protein
MPPMMRWYNPRLRVEEEVSTPMSEAQAIEMLSGHPDSDRFIEVYRLAQEGSEGPQSLALLALKDEL